MWTYVDDAEFSLHLDSFFQLLTIWKLPREAKSAFQLLPVMQTYWLHVYFLFYFIDNKTLRMSVVKYR